MSSNETNQLCQDVSLHWATHISPIVPALILQWMMCSLLTEAYLVIPWGASLHLQRHAPGNLLRDSPGHISKIRKLGRCSCGLRRPILHCSSGIACPGRLESMGSSRLPVVSHHKANRWLPQSSGKNYYHLLSGHRFFAFVAQQMV